jgi:hypothetical protein
MFDSFTYFLYIILLIVLVILTGYKQKFVSSELSFEAKPKIQLQQFLALLLLAFIIGFRYEVGVDWFGYKTYFESIKNNPSLTINDQMMEPGFYYINKVIANWGLSYEWMFFAIAFLSWLFYFKSVPPFILPLFIFFLFVDEYFFWGMNGVRQFAAMSIWLFSIRFIVNKKILKYIFLILLASIFHRSVLILFPFYFLPQIKNYKKYLMISIFFISILFGTSKTFISLIEEFTLWLGQYFDFIGTYSNYISSDYFTINTEIEGGLGYIFKIIVNLSIFILGGSVVKKKPELSIYFILFFIGAIIFNLSYNVQILGRFNNYFLIFRPVVISFIIWYYWKIPNYRLIIITFCSLYLILFLRAIYSSSNMCSPYQFSFFVL